MKYLIILFLLMFSFKANADFLTGYIISSSSCSCPTCGPTYKGIFDGYFEVKYYDRTDSNLICIEKMESSGCERAKCKTSVTYQKYIEKQLGHSNFEIVMQELVPNNDNLYIYYKLK